MVAFAVAASQASARAASKLQQRTAAIPASIRAHRGSCKVQARPQVAVRVSTPVREQWSGTLHLPNEDVVTAAALPQLITRETVRALEAELDNGTSIAALRRFNNALRAVPADKWESALRPVFAELCLNLESFNPAFTACLLMVQKTLGVSDYVRRDVALKNLIQPLAGEYGMHNNQPQLKTHRELFSDFFQSLFGYPLAQLVADSAEPEAALKLHSQMQRDILGGGGCTDALEQASYALGYNLAIEYLADYEKTWMLDSFRDLNQRVLHKEIDWIFLEVHAEGEAEHAAIGHNAVLSLVPAAHEPLLRRAMADHDRDFAVFYNRMADILSAAA